MRRWKSIIRGAVLAAAVGNLGGLSRVMAGDSATGPFNLSADETPKYLDESLPSRAPGAPVQLNTERAPLMSLFDSLGIVRPLDDMRINIYGWIEGSYNYNFNNPKQGLNFGREFDFYDNRGELNQVNVTFERKADPKQWDLGGMAEIFYGTDARFTTSSGFLDKLDDTAEYQLDIPQLYLDFSIPLGNGIRVRAGKFLFFKQIDPNASVFYSHSFAFGGAMPFTLTGVTVYYPITEQVNIEAGFSRGWGQTLTDNNSAIDGLGRIKWAISEQTSASVAVICGPEYDHDDSHYTTVVDATLTQVVTDHLTLLFDGVYGDSAEPSGVREARWYGVSGYAVLKCCDEANLNFRAEVFRDEEGITTEPFGSVTSEVTVPGFGVLPRVGPALYGQTLFEVTVGMTLTPFAKNSLGSNLKIRPEVRYDYSTRPYFNGLTEHGQFTVAVDAYFDF